VFFFCEMDELDVLPSKDAFLMSHIQVCISVCLFLYPSGPVSPLCACVLTGSCKFKEQSTPSKWESSWANSLSIFSFSGALYFDRNQNAPLTSMSALTSNSGNSPELDNKEIHL
jgi:hypothetical protein